MIRSFNQIKGKAIIFVIFLANKLKLKQPIGAELLGTFQKLSNIPDLSLINH